LAGLKVVTALIDALGQEGLVSVLAEPTLTAVSGQKANFLAGGEFPIPVAQSLGNVSIESDASASVWNSRRQCFLMISSACRFVRK
jgi:Flp pilus assembly secretin CpaC